MSSKNAELVAQDVIETVRNGKKINMGKIIRKRGYSDGISKQPNRVTKTKSYQAVVKPIVEQLNELRQKAINELQKRKLSPVKYKELVAALDLFTKNSQLLSGGETERTKLIVLPSEIVDKNSLDKE